MPHIDCGVMIRLNSCWTWLTSTSCRFSVIPESILPKCYAYTSTDVNAVIYIGWFLKGIDVVVHQFHLDAGCYMMFTKLFGNFFRLTVFGRNCVELNFTDVDVQTVSLHFFCFLYNKMVLYNYFTYNLQADVEPLQVLHDVVPISITTPTAVEKPVPHVEPLAAALTEQPNAHRYDFVRMSNKYFRFPDVVSKMVELHLYLTPITIRNLHQSPQHQRFLGVRPERNGQCFRYALTGWARYMKFAGI
ncbi:hypothetical protein Hanom_Chr06g00479141 [Helianthus anomalus]